MNLLNHPVGGRLLELLEELLELLELCLSALDGVLEVDAGLLPCHCAGLRVAVNQVDTSCEHPCTLVTRTSHLE